MLVYFMPTKELISLITEINYIKERFLKNLPKESVIEKGSWNKRIWKIESEIVEYYSKLVKHKLEIIKLLEQENLDISMSEVYSSLIIKIDEHVDIIENAVDISSIDNLT